MILKVVLSNSASLATCEKAIAKENDYSADQERLQRAVRGLAHRQRGPANLVGKATLTRSDLIKFGN
jgi:hypothetical protein